MLAILIVALGGAAGASARFWLSGVVARRVGETFPWGTMVVNLSGAFAIGLLAARFLVDEGVAEPWRHLWLALVVGVLGSYTTVSSFSLQTLALVRAGEGARAVANVLGSLVGCLLAAFSGHRLGLALFGAIGA